MARQWLMAVTSEGDRVAETDDVGEQPDTLIQDVRASGAQLIWVHTNLDLSPFGFRRTSGYTRLHADSPGVGEPLPTLAADGYAKTLDRAYHGLWGHKQVAADAAPPDDAIVLGLLRDDREPIGLCRVFVSERLVDGPGVAAGARAPHNYLRLLSGACALLGPGPIDVDSWGDTEETLACYAALGFAPVEQLGGWELKLNEDWADTTRTGGVVRPAQA